jgi:tRNA 2-thiocytidine biosynthesis protein TtcA
LNISGYADTQSFPIIPCDLCGSQPNLQRQAIKEMLTVWREKHPGRIENIFQAIRNVSPSQLADHELFDFINLGAEKPWIEENSSKLQVLPDLPVQRVS